MEKKDYIEFILNNLRSEWDTKRGLSIFVFLLFFGCLYFFGSVDLEEISVKEFLVTLSILSVAVLFWLFTNTKKAAKRKIGIGISVSYEEEDPAAKKLHRDFILSLRNALKAAELSHDFQVIEYNNYVSKKINSGGDAKKLANRGRLKFLLHGHTRIRDTKEGPIHIIDLHGLVKHVPLDIILSKQFSDEFSDVLKNFKFSIEENISGCDFAASHISAVTKYIVAIAATFSNDLDYAEQLLIDSANSLQMQDEEADRLLGNIKDRVNKQTQDLLIFKMRSLRDEYSRTYNDEILPEIEEYIRKADEFNAEDSAVVHNKAICAFLLRRDIEASERELSSIKDMEDPIWLLNMAFIHAYKKDLGEAYRMYSKAFRKPISDATVIAQCEQFIQKIIDEEPEQTQLYFCLGLINYKYKFDYKAAKADFRSFLDKADKDKFSKQFEVAENWLDEIESSKKKKVS